MTGLRTGRRSSIPPGSLHTSHICSFQAGGLSRWCIGCPNSFLSFVLSFHLCQLSLLLHIRFKARVAVRIDRFFGKVVCAAAS